MSVRRRSQHLRRVFSGLVLAAAPLAAAQACSDDVIVREIPGAPEDTAGPEASDEDLARDGALEAFATLDATCQVVVETLDAGQPDGDPPCRYTLPCGLASGTAFVIRGCGFYLVEPDDAGDASLGCAIPPEYGCADDVYAPPANGSLTFECLDCLGGAGRRPNGLLRTHAIQETATSALAAWLARMAGGEAASIHAFARMHEELAAFGAPRALVGAARRSERDERRHARLMGQAARAHGATPRAPRVRRPRTRALESMARENAAEGCVREAFGALVLRWQAAQAATPELRRLLGGLAEDETRHAALSWEVATWAEARLSPRARARVASARRCALRDLEDCIAKRHATMLDPVVGQPSSRIALLLHAGLARELARSGLS